MHVDVLGVPKSQGSTRAFVAKGRAYVASNHKQDFVVWRNSIVERTERMWDGEPCEMAEVILDFRLPIPKSRPKYLAGFTPHGKKPDVDKLTRAVLDALVAAGVIRDDSGVWALTATKRYADRPGVDIYVNATEIPVSPRAKKGGE